MAALYSARHLGVPVGSALADVTPALPGAYPTRVFRAAPDRLAPGADGTIDPMTLQVLPCEDSDTIARARKAELFTTRDRATALGRGAVRAAAEGCYLREDGSYVDWSMAVAHTIDSKLSIPPDGDLPTPSLRRFDRTTVQVANATTLAAAHRLVERGEPPLALNLANGVTPGGGFLHGARAQEESLCRSSALYATLHGDPMYVAHRRNGHKESSDWAILSPDVPVFRTDDGTTQPTAWLCSFLTCAAPYAPEVSQPRSGDLLATRIRRVLGIAHAYGYDTLVLGAWGCGAFGNDPHRTAADFHAALTGPFDGAFATIVFAITDWSPDRRTLGPFRDTFAP